MSSLVKRMLSNDDVALRNRSQFTYHDKEWPVAPIDGPIRPPANTDDFDRNKTRLRNCNYAAAIFHAASFVAALTVTLVFLGGSAKVALTTDFTVYDANATVSTGGTAPDQAGPFSNLCSTLVYYQIIWVVEFEPLITAGFHFVIAAIPTVNDWYSENVLVAGRNPLRWIEYSVTATLMLWVIAQLSGITNVLLLVNIAVGNIALQWMGYLMEEMNSHSRISAANGKPAKPVRWAPTVIGWLLFAVGWAAIFAYFFTAITSPRPLGTETVPSYVYVTVIGMCAQFSLFGVVMLAHYANCRNLLWPLFNNEVAYIVLSFVSKFTLTWTLVIGVATNQRGSV